MPEYAARSKYVITNIGYGSITYGFKGAPVTHLYIGFKESDNNILVKAQGAGRACGYVQQDLDRYGGHVKVLCTRKDFEDIQTGLSQFIKEAYEQYPNHVNGTYTNDVVKERILGHASNPMAAEARVMATVPRKVGSGSGVEPEQEQQDRSHLYSSKEEEVHQFVVADAQKSILRDEDDIIVSEAREYATLLKKMYPDVLMTTRLVFVTGNNDHIAEQERDKMSIKTAIGSALREEQVRDLPKQTPKTGGIWADETKHRFYTGNPAHHGCKGGKNPETKYRMQYAFDSMERQMVGVVRTTAFYDLALPFLHQRLEIQEDGNLCVKTFLVTEGTAGGKRSRQRSVEHGPKIKKSQKTDII